MLAARNNVSRRTNSRVVKDALKRPLLRKVETRAAKFEHRGKRAQAGKKVLRRIDGGEFGASDMFWTDESWFGATVNRLDPQNMRIYGQKGSKKADPAH